MREAEGVIENGVWGEEVVREYKGFMGWGCTIREQSERICSLEN